MIVIAARTIVGNRRTTTAMLLGCRPATGVCGRRYLSAVTAAQSSSSAAAGTAAATASSSPVATSCGEGVPSPSSSPLAAASTSFSTLSSSGEDLLSAAAAAMSPEWTPTIPFPNTKNHSAAVVTGSDPNHQLICLREKLGLGNKETDYDSIPLLQLQHQQQLHFYSQKHNTHRPWVVGHHGAPFVALENTRAGFLQCAQWGCDAVELDVFYLEKDGSLVVFHGGGSDQRPGELTNYCMNMSGVSILDLTYTDCQQLQFNPTHAEFPCPVENIQVVRGIPTLEQVLMDVKQYHLNNPQQRRKMNIKIELKTVEAALPALLLVERLGMVDVVQFSSFHHDALDYIRQLRPMIRRHSNNDKENNTKTNQQPNYVYRTGALFKGGAVVNVDTNNDLGGGVHFVNQAIQIGASEIHLRYDDCSVQNIQAIRDAGLTSMAWLRGPMAMSHDLRFTYQDNDNDNNVEGISIYQLLLETGVDQICCNRPNVLLDLLLQQEQEAQVQTITTTVMALQ